MWRSEWQNYIDVLQQEVVPALGCTEPVSTALAAAHAVRLLNDQPERLEIYVSPNLLKNGMGVGIPGTGEVGLQMAAAIGAIAGDADKGLQVLENIQPQQVKEAKQMVSEQRVSIGIADTDSVLYSEVIAHKGTEQARVIIKDRHTTVTFQALNDKPLATASSDTCKSVCSFKYEMSVDDIFQFATDADIEKLRFILQAAELNKALSEAGLTQDFGLKVGKTLKNNVEKGWLADDLAVSAMMRSSGASDARMDGAMLAAMSNSGSGNQGISATMPVVAVAEKIGASEEQMIRALIISHLTAIHIKSHLNILSALCGATTAGTGASAAITWLLGGDLKAVHYAIFNMIGDITGIFCDGAKTSCALKVSTSAAAAVKAAMMALEGVRVRNHEGIIEEDLEQTIDNLGLIGNQAMNETDKMIVKIMMNKYAH